MSTNETKVDQEGNVLSREVPMNQTAVLKNVDISKWVRNINNNDYLMVAGRVILVHGDLNSLDITTEVVPELTNLTIENGRYKGAVTVKATVRTPKGTFTGYSMASAHAGGAEGSAPIEVAETSAVGRALGFAGYGLEYGIASAEELYKVGAGRSDDRSGGTAVITGRGPNTSVSNASSASSSNGSNDDGDSPIDTARKRAIQNIGKVLARRNIDINEIIKSTTGKENLDDLTIEEAIQVINEANKAIRS